MLLAVRAAGRDGLGRHGRARLKPRGRRGGAGRVRAHAWLGKWRHHGRGVHAVRAHGADGDALPARRQGVLPRPRVVRGVRAPVPVVRRAPRHDRRLVVPPQPGRGQPRARARHGIARRLGAPVGHRGRAGGRREAHAAVRRVLGRAAAARRGRRAADVRRADIGGVSSREGRRGRGGRTGRRGAPR